MVPKNRFRTRFAQRLTDARGELGLTPAELAKRVGVGSGLVSEWEEDRSIPNQAAVSALAASLGKDALDLELCLLEDTTARGAGWGISPEREGRLLAIGNDPSIALHRRLEALKMFVQTEADPWPPGLLECYDSILSDESLSIVDRIEVAWECSNFDDLLRAERHALLSRAAEIEDLPPRIDLQVSSYIGGPAGLTRLARLMSHPDPAVAEEAKQRVGSMARSLVRSSLREAALDVYHGRDAAVGHVFVSYVREDQTLVERLIAELREHGVPVWLDQEDLRPGQRWKREISRAIAEGGAFLAVFSEQSENRDRSFMRSELLDAVAELRLRARDRTWFVPVVLSLCSIPDLPIGGGETLRDLQYVALYEDWSENVRKLADVLNEAVLNRRE